MNNYIDILSTLKQTKLPINLVSDRERPLFLDLIKQGRIKVLNDAYKLSDSYFKNMKEFLYVYQNNIIIGYLGYDAIKGYMFAYDTNYLIGDNKFVKFNMPFSFKTYIQQECFSDFEEHLPEGIDRDILIKKSGTNIEFYLLKNNDYNANDLIFSKDKPLIKNTSVKVLYESLKKEILDYNFFPNILNLKVDIDDNNLFLSQKNEKEIRNLSLSGCQHKLAVVIDDGVIRLPNKNPKENIEYFIKPYSKEKAIFSKNNYIPHLAMNEHLFISFAKNELKFDVPKTALFKKDDDLEYHYLVRYFDRYKSYKIDKKEFSSFLNLNSENKYKTTTEKLFKKAIEILDYNDRLRLLDYFFYSFVIKHSDLHTKNISILYENGKYILAPLYDICSTGIYKGFPFESGLLINGKNKNILFDDFLKICNVANIKESDFKDNAKFILNTYFDKMPEYINEVKKLNLAFLINNYKTITLGEVFDKYYNKRIDELKKWLDFFDIKTSKIGKDFIF